jgi:hypothetical protein
MGIDSNIRVVCDDLQRAGGVTQIYLRSWAAGDEVDFVNTATNHGISSIVDIGGSTADWQFFDCKAETATLDIAATKENGITAFECTLSWYIPRMSGTTGSEDQLDKFHTLQEIVGGIDTGATCMMAIATDSNGTHWVIGASEKFSVGGTGSGEIYRSQTFADLTGMEGSTGSAYQDENGITVTIMAKQYELPRAYGGTLDPTISAGTATTN